MIDNWFLGFFEADGCFTYDRSGYCRPVMQILQQDDMGCVPPANRLVSILFAGDTALVKPKTLRHNNSEYEPRWKSAARRKDSLLRAVWFFDQHPLMSARKQRDYEIWRKMALCYIAHGASGKEQLLALADELSSDGRTKNKGVAP